MRRRIPHILNTLKVFSFAESLGGVESLITYLLKLNADIPAEVRHSYGLRQMTSYACLSVLRMLEI